MLMRRAVPVARQRLALTGGAPTSRGTAFQRIPVCVVAVSWLLRKEFLGTCEIALDDVPDTRLRLHRKERTDVREQRPCRLREVVAIGGEALHVCLTRLQHCLTSVFRTRVDVDVLREFAIHGPADLIHE